MNILIRRLFDKFGPNYIFLFIVILFFLTISLFSIDRGLDIITNFSKLLIKLIPIVIGVYILIFAFILLIDNTKLQDYLNKGQYLYKLIFSIIIGIISSGPVYLWYPLFKKLKSNGLSEGHLASLIYARAIKIPLIPVMIFYLGIKFTIIFNSVILILSFIFGPIFDYILNLKIIKKG